MFNDNDLYKLIEKKFPNAYKQTPYALKIINSIIYALPKRPDEAEIAQQMNISVKWMQHECKKAFNLTFMQLSRYLRVFMAVNLMHEANLKNKDIAQRLSYTSASNMARDFRIVLNNSPKNIRQLLSTVSVLDIFLTSNQF